MISAEQWMAFSGEIEKLAAKRARKKAANKYNNRKKTAMFDEGGNVPPSPQSKKIPKRPRNAAWQYDPRPVWTL